jgi:hypothetical protein
MKDREREYKELIGKQVTIFKVDGFVKKGKLVKVLPTMIELEFYNGVHEFIPFVQISAFRVEK